MYELDFSRNGGSKAKLCPSLQEHAAVFVAIQTKNVCARLETSEGFT